MIDLHYCKQCNEDITFFEGYQTLPDWCTACAESYVRDKAMKLKKVFGFA